MDIISWQYFEKVELRVCTVVDVQAFPETRRRRFNMAQTPWEDMVACSGC